MEDTVGTVVVIGALGMMICVSSFVFCSLPCCSNTLAKIRNLAVFFTKSRSRVHSDSSSSSSGMTILDPEPTTAPPGSFLVQSSDPPVGGRTRILRVFALTSSPMLSTTEPAPTRWTLGAGHDVLYLEEPPPSYSSLFPQSTSSREVDV